ncbi:metallophosphoesterase [uncultured Flavonifractor sp.]|uniref:metallophosphoesterase n=1 Tax=uncultured Flavonifractor sp. TaxID=1193534 RepID=UPI0026225CBF|nr:metallophosphoesterase [uncultured Flavonifractor sp.]
MVYCISDLHGDYFKYRTLLENLSFQSRDTLYVLGDVIDRGPDGVRLLQDMMTRPNVVPILGNHELTAAICLRWLLEEITEARLAALGTEQLAVYQNWMHNGGEPTLRALSRLSQEERQELLAYLQEMDLYAQVKAGGRTFVLVHGGLDHFAPDKALEDYELEDFLFCRPRPDAVFYPDRFLVYGHTPTRLLHHQMGNPPSDTIFRHGNQIAIDCGCGHGGKLGCLCLETLEEFYV